MRHALEPAFSANAASPEAVLALLPDPACGSVAFLVEAANAVIWRLRLAF